MPLHVRAAGLDDAHAIASVQVNGWKAAYRGQMPQAFLDALDVAARAATWRHFLGTAQRDVLVAEMPAGIVAFCSLAPSRDADADATTAELAAIYVLPEMWRRGIGAALIAEAFRIARDRRYEQMTLWVLESNNEARRFYERYSFTLDGALKDDNSWGDFVLREVRYRAALK
jgi:GNAT superfamily N-acetyltransferase